MRTEVKNGRCFTEAAREAAALARRRKRELKAQFPEQHEFAMVVVRSAVDPQGFAWQIRRFGRMSPVAESEGTFKDAASAARSGEAALAAMLRVSTAAG